MDLSHLPTLTKNMDDGIEVAILSNSDSSVAPKGKSAVLILGNGKYNDFAERETDKYKLQKDEFAKKLIKKAEKIIPGLSEKIIVMDAATPKTMERYTLMPEGALYSFDQSAKVKRPYFKTPVRGLYLASASTFPGGGIEATTISGIICANDINGWQKNI